MKRLVTIALPLAIVACGGDEVRWNQRPTKAVTASVDGHAIALRLPDDASERGSPTGGSTDFAGKGYDLSLFKLLTKHRGVQTLQETIEGDRQFRLKVTTTSSTGAQVRSSPKPPLMVKGDGYDFALVNHHDNSDWILVYAQRPVADGVIACEARVYVPQGADVKAMAAPALDLCGSLAVAKS